MVILAKRVLSCEEDNPLYNCVLENSTNTGDLEHDQSVYECLHDVICLSPGCHVQKSCLLVVSIPLLQIK